VDDAALDVRAHSSGACTGGPPMAPFTGGKLFFAGLSRRCAADEASSCAARSAGAPAMPLRSGLHTGVSTAGPRCIVAPAAEYSACLLSGVWSGAPPRACAPALSARGSAGAAAADPGTPLPGVLVLAAELPHPMGLLKVGPRAVRPGRR
jgi:hypothetical protein